MKKTIITTSILTFLASVAFAQVPSITFEDETLSTSSPLYAGEITNGLNVDIIDCTSGGSMLRVTDTDSSGDIYVNFKDSTIPMFAIGANSHKTHTGNFYVTIDGGAISEFYTKLASTIDGDVNVTVNSGKIGMIMDGLGGTITGSYNTTINATDSNNPISIDVIGANSATMNYTFTGNSKNLSIGAIGVSDNGVFTFGNENNAFNGTFDASICKIQDGSSASLSNVVVANGNMSFSNLDVETLTVVASENNKVKLAEGSTFENIVIEVSDDVMNSETFDVGVVLAGISEDDLGKISLQNANGERYTGTITYTPQVPEPAQWAVIFGAIALGFVAYRRRK